MTTHPDQLEYQGVLYEQTIKWDWDNINKSEYYICIVTRHNPKRKETWKIYAPTLEKAKEIAQYHFYKSDPNKDIAIYSIMDYIITQL